RAESKTPRRSGAMLLAIEGENGLDSLVAITATLAKALDAAVTVVHVSYPGGEELERAVYHATKTHGEHALSVAVARLVKAGVEARSMSLTARGGVSRALAKCADDMGADLIVMGSHRTEPAAGEILAPISTAVSHLTSRPIVVTGELDEPT
ncbi:MAG TPA: universal stress protein, partial [Patescibacteria group bacterium]|nr:universal stress protein [Patescibacteria group bacterium]